MLKIEVAKERLAQWRMPAGTSRLAKEAARLPADLRELADRVYSIWESDTELEWTEEQRRKREVGRALDRETPARREKVFAIVSPQLAPRLERAWQAFKSEPYQDGYVRKAFRAPHDPDLTIENRLNWLYLIGRLGDCFQRDVLTLRWLAAWAPYLDHDGFGVATCAVAPLLAVALNERDAEGDEIFEILRESLTNEHEIGAPGRHITRALLLSNRPEGWELIEKTLLAAQRQEGLRQEILEAVDLAHPEAFRRMLRLILAEDLMRFSSVVRAFDAWFGYLWAAASPGVVKNALARVVDYLEDPAARKKALRGADAEGAFLALWCEATEDAVASVSSAESLLAAGSAELRYAAVRHLVNLNLNVAVAALTPVLDDPDLRVARLALEGASNELDQQQRDARFEKLERLLSRLPEKPQQLKPIVWPWTATTITRAHAASALIDSLGDRSANFLIPHLSAFAPGDRYSAAFRLVNRKTWDDQTRRAILNLAGDSAGNVREVCLSALAERGTRAEEIPVLESYLKRKASDLRRGVVDVLLRQQTPAAVASGRRLLDSRDANQRLAGLELLRRLCEAERSREECRELADNFASKRRQLTKVEQAHLDEIRNETVVAATLDDALGLMNPADRTPVTQPRKRKVSFITKAAVACLDALDELVHEHRESTIRIEMFDGQVQETLLGAAYWLPGPIANNPRAGQQERLPLAEVWLTWNAERGKRFRDGDGLELLRASACKGILSSDWKDWSSKSRARKRVASALSGGQQLGELRYPRLVLQIVDWLLFLSPPEGREFLLDAIEASWALVPREEMARLAELRSAPKSYSYWFDRKVDTDWRLAEPFNLWKKPLSEHVQHADRKLTPEQVIRLWRLQHWRDRPIDGANRHRVETNLLMQAYHLRAANIADVADHLLGPRGVDRYGSAESFALLAQFTNRNRDKEVDDWLAAHPEVEELTQRAVHRILELELNRGDAPTAATVAVSAIGSLSGIDTLRRVLHALGKAEFKTDFSWSAVSNERRPSLTALARVVYPAEGETPEDFRRIMQAAVAAGEFPEARLLQLVFLAPQWIRFVEAYLDWPRMSEGVYWFLAHMKYVSGSAEDAAAIGSGMTPEEQGANDSANGDSEVGQPRKLSAWERLIVERTPLTENDRQEGAIDVAWFRETYQLLGAERWQALAAAARFASTAAQARRAQFIANVLLDHVPRAELIDGIQKKQLKEHVRLLGLLPLATGKKRKADLLERCQTLRDYRRYANQLSGLTKPAALRAWEIGMKNLAQTAGYADPLRLEWAIGAEAVADLAQGPVTASKDGVTVSLSLDELSRPALTVQKGEKSLKSIPPAVKKDARIAALAGRVTDLKRQAAAIRLSLESAMCRGDAFTGEELKHWASHALLAPLLSRLVVVGEGIMGYPDRGGKALRDYRGKLEPVKAGETLRVAHAHDLFESGKWHDWQRDCFQAERVQPFKQIFRELYVLTSQEKKDGAVSHRYDGLQIQPQQALALFGSRGWNTRDGVFQVFHDAGLTAEIGFLFAGGTPLEVEGWTLDGVSFRARDQFLPVPLNSIPPRLFSETMRDLDLVVSVAHAGGVDPEASASTVEMRSGLLRETCALLKLKNVRLKAAHAVIDGELANYTVHLGSGVVHRMPGGSLCIVPVHAQHRGRLFLPFADDDPRTAEVISKVLLLARDRDIQDAGILEQLRR